MILYQTKFLTLKSAKREGSNDWVYAHRPNAKDIAVILPVIKKQDGDEILFLITKRPPLLEEHVAEFCVETPAGLVGDENKDECVEDALKKELLEETGLEADKFIIKTRKMASSSGLTSETSTVAIAIITDTKIKASPVSDGGVIINRVYVKKENVRNFLHECEKKGYALSSQMLACLYLAEL